MTTDKAQRICIIGAGAAGLTAAETLKRLGYRHVTILEREARAGGKCYSLDHDGRSYELGAGIIAANNHTVQQLAKHYGVPFERVQFGESILLDVATGKPLAEKTLLQQLATLRQLVFKYVPLITKYRNVAQPGLAKLSPELCVPFSDWAKQHHIELVAAELAPFFTGFGYDYFERVPAAYVLKYYSWATLKSFAQRKLYKFPHGIQTLWTTVAQAHNVRYNTVIQKITRGATVTITTTTDTIECDRLIITSPLDEALQFIDANPLEQELFSKIQYSDYRTYALWLHDFPKMSGYLPGNYTSSRTGQPVFWYLRHADINLYTFYTLADWQLTDEAALHSITQVVQQLGGSMERVHTIQHWKYFPHISSEIMCQGYFDQLESLQGQRQTYYAGEVMNFSTVGLSAEYAEHLVHRFFA